MAGVKRKAIDRFLSSKRIAMVGVSRQSNDFSRLLFREMAGRGYDMVPVNPAASEIENRRCFRDVGEISPPVEAALLLTPAGESERVLQDCASAGIPRVWLHRSSGQGAVSPEAVHYCRQHGMDAVIGECPFMFLENAGWFHTAHRFLRKAAGALPV